ncbi:MAG: TIGR04168 family protein [Geitlerinemataceae cyanobacterium]
MRSLGSRRFDINDIDDRLQTLTIAVVGDVHDRWEYADEIALKHLGVDLVLFVGDFGNESVPVVRQIAQLDLPKASILGNHDAWYTATEWGRKKCPYDRNQENRVQQQLDLLGQTHVGYRALDFPELGLAVVGSRPFSWGGSKWRNSEFYRQWYGVTSFQESIDRIVSVATETICDTLIFIGHTGPTGLGDLPEDPCGKDWEPRGGDYGDPDFEAAIDLVQQSGKSIPLVTFGHMHHQLRHTKQQLRRCIHLSPQGTVYLNAANVPRIVSTPTGTVRNFSLVSFQSGVVRQINRVWVDENYKVIEQIWLYDRNAPIPVNSINNLDGVG